MKCPVIEDGCVDYGGYSTHDFFYYICDSHQYPEPPKMIINIPFKVKQWKEEGVWYVFSKEFDITGYGYSRVAARESFIIQVEELLSLAIDATKYDDLLNPELN